ncbi:aspartate carbamoyltransferase catalytic subunit [Helicobacter sp. faydin-H20]|uniref:aspartate carbamoyltransferase catalytic subunit n=1 Tax=Helicobacter anatolicus TaxID=2905874 RepID=UPI001E34DFD1|nr:aspartate carbamoyltransferase catalytic subunit [Helicobacter anatolicus]MCE3036687.1 aspartate carbamoyltransferase catalytic subunit [Helicobacter anatolicus]
MQHFIKTSDLDIPTIHKILEKANHYRDKTPEKILEDKTIITAFFENSTRTLSSFEIAAKNLGAKVIRLDVSKSSTSKGETIADTAANLNAMNPHAIIIRHKNAGAGEHLARHVDCPIINGGDGAHAHPTQALLDLLTIFNHFKGDIKGKKVGIVGDIKNSRVANSNIELLTRFGLDIILIAPPHFLPYTTLKTSHNLKESIKNLDILISLRTQTERHNYQIYGSLKDYAKDFCVTKDLIANQDIIILHPGPVHHNIDLDDEVLKDDRCKVLDQVNNGVLIRMAVIEHCVL